MAASIQVDPDDWLQSNAFDVTDVDQQVYDRIHEAYGMNIEMRRKKILREAGGVAVVRRPGIE